MVPIRIIILIIVCFFFFSCQEKEIWQDAPSSVDRWYVVNKTTKTLKISTWLRENKRFEKELLKPNSKLCLTFGHVDQGLADYFPVDVTKLEITTKNGSSIIQECLFISQYARDSCDLRGTIFDHDALYTETKSYGILRKKKTYYYYDITPEVLDGA